MIAALLGLPLAALLAALALLLLAAWCVALALAAGNGPDDDDDPQRERQRVDSIRAELDALEQADDTERQRNVVWLSPGQAAARRRVRAGSAPPADAPGEAHRINVDVWSQP